MGIPRACIYFEKIGDGNRSRKRLVKMGSAGVNGAVIVLMAVCAAVIQYSTLLNSICLHIVR